MLPDEKIANLSTSTNCNINVSSTDKTTTANAARTTTTDIKSFYNEDQQSNNTDKKSCLQSTKNIVELSLISDTEQTNKKSPNSLSPGKKIKLN